LYGDEMQTGIRTVTRFHNRPVLVLKQPLQLLPLGRCSLPLAAQGPMDHLMWKLRLHNCAHLQVGVLCNSCFVIQMNFYAQLFILFYLPCCVHDLEIDAMTLILEFHLAVVNVPAY